MRTVIATALAAIVLVISSQMTALCQLWLIWGLLLGLATGVTANVLAALVAARWFVKKRGLVIGLLTASNATEQLLFLPLAAWIGRPDDLLHRTAWRGRPSKNFFAAAAATCSGFYLCGTWTWIVVGIVRSMATHAARSG